MENNKKTPTKTQIEVMMSDWFRNLRQQGTFIHKDTKGTMKVKGSELSEFIIGSIDESKTLEIIASAREIAQNTVNSMTSVPVQVKVGGSTSATNGEVINVATNFFDDSRLTLQQKIDLLIGFSIHEACHINHTDMTVLEKIRKSKDSEQIKRLKLDIQNIIEDERIEYLLGDSEHPEGDAMPGFSDFLHCCKEYAFGKYSDGLTGDAIKDPLNKFINTLVAAVRFPSMLTEDLIVDQYDNLKKVKDILTPFPLSQKGVVDATDRIMDVIYDMVEDDMKQQQEQQQASQSGNPGSSGSAGSNNQQSSENNDQQNKNDGQGNKKQNPSKDEVKQQLENMLNSQESEKLLQKMESLSQMSSGDKSQNQAYDISRDYNKAQYANGEAEKVETICEGGYYGGRAQTTYLISMNDNKPQYDLSLGRIKRYIPAMSKSLRCKTTDKDYELQGMKSGKLNTNKLVTLKTGNQNVFSKKGTVSCDSACVCILIDESGSMSGRLKDARDAAVLINEAVRRIPNLELFSYGFTDDEMNIYCERNKSSRYALGNTRASGGTPTGTAMKIAGQRIRRLTSSKCLMLVLTDGAPDSKMLVQKQDQELRRQGIIPIGVGIQDAPVQDSFMDSVSIADISQLPVELGRLMKKKLQKMLKKKDSDE